MSAVKYAAIFFVILLSTIGDKVQADVGELKIDGRKPVTERKKQASKTTKKNKQHPVANVYRKKAVVIIRQPCPPAPQPQCSMADVTRTEWQQFNKKIKEETPLLVRSAKEAASKITRDVISVISGFTGHKKASGRSK